jgi:hypothetical protein
MRFEPSAPQDNNRRLRPPRCGGDETGNLLASRLSRRFTRDAIDPSVDGNNPSRSGGGNSASMDDGTRGRKSRVASMEQLRIPRPQPAHMRLSNRIPNTRIAIQSGIAARRRWALRESQPQRAALLLPVAEPQPPGAVVPRPEVEPLLQGEAGALYKGRRRQPRPGLRRPR